MTNTQRPQHPPAGPVRKRGVVVFLGSRTGLIRDFDSGKQILFRRDESEIDRDGAEVEFDLGVDPRNGQIIATRVRASQ